MYSSIRHILCRVAGSALLALPLAAGLSSCDMVYDDLSSCDKGLRIRFIYDYNMEFANSFYSQVDCLTVHVYDEQQNHVATFTESTDVLADEGYRMTLDLEPGEYTLLCYGGVECEDASYSHTSIPEKGNHISTTGLSLMPECLDGSERGRLHDMYYGRKKVIVNDGLGYDEVTVEMMKDTNHIRVMLQQLSWEPVDGKDFEFRIVDDNTRYDHNNMTLPVGEVNYVPWAVGTQTTGYVTRGEEEPQEVKVGYAEISTGRLLTSNNPRLVIRSKEHNRDIIDIPLNKYLLMMKSDRPEYKKLENQEFLDRESRWNLFFFLDRDHAWVKSSIIVNDWEVKINDIEM